MQRARRLFPGGVNSPVRAFGGVGGERSTGSFVEQVKINYEIST
jgi:glutamate-1-semialdehyde aminotransferase